MKKKIIIIGFLLPLLVSCKENKRVIETESTSVENVEKISSNNNLSNNEKNNSNIKDNEKVKEEENNEEIDPIFNELEGKTFVYKHVNDRYYQSLTFEKNGIFNSEYTTSQIDTSGEFFDYRNICQMQGKFIVENRLDDTCYILRLINPTITSKTGQSEVVEDDGYRHKIEYTDLKGALSLDDLKGENEFQDLYTLYLPGRSKDSMTDKLKQNLENLYISFEGQSPYYLLVNNNSTAFFIEGLEWF